MNLGPININISCGYYEMAHFQLFMVFDDWNKRRSQLALVICSLSQLVVLLLINQTE